MDCRLLGRYPDAPDPQLAGHKAPCGSNLAGGRRWQTTAGIWPNAADTSAATCPEYAREPLGPAVRPATPPSPATPHFRRLDMGGPGAMNEALARRGFTARVWRFRCCNPWLAAGCCSNQSPGSGPRW